MSDFRTVMIKNVMDKTGLGVRECKVALKNNNWNYELTLEKLMNREKVKGDENMLNVIKVSISENCIRCGACLSYTELFEKASGGKVKVLGNGTVPSDKVELVREAVKLCPVSAIQITEEEVSQEQKEKIKKRLQELTNFSYPVPTYKDISFDDCSTTFEQNARFHSGYEYSSESAAERAGLSELRSGLFSRLDSIGKHMLHDYEKQVLSRVCTYDKNDKNFAYRINKQITEELQELRREAEVIVGHPFELPTDFEVIDVSPDFSKNTILNNTFLYRFVNIADTYLPSSMKENVESADWYSSWINTDEMEVWSGRSTKTKYAYDNCEAILKIKEHYCKGADDAVKEYVTNQLKGSSWTSIYAPIVKEIQAKAKRILSELSK